MGRLWDGQTRFGIGWFWYMESKIPYIRQRHGGFKRPLAKMGCTDRPSVGDGCFVMTIGAGQWPRDKRCPPGATCASILIRATVFARPIVRTMSGAFESETTKTSSCSINEPSYKRPPGIYTIGPIAVPGVERENRPYFTAKAEQGKNSDPKLVVTGLAGRGAPYDFRRRTGYSRFMRR